MIAIVIVVWYEGKWDGMVRRNGMAWYGVERGMMRKGRIVR